MKLHEALAQSDVQLAIAPYTGYSSDILMAGPLYEEPAAGVSAAYEACKWYILQHDQRSRTVEGWPVDDVAQLASDPDGWQPVSSDSCMW